MNSYMYANALAISKIANLAGNTSTANTYKATADTIRARLLSSLWNSTYVHFIDRYYVTNSYVTYWNYINGRELVGFVPWQFNVPDNNSTYNAAWQHLMDTSKVLGQYGLRTVEPSYEYYMKQYRYDAATGKPECQWNGPSWPYLTTQVLDAMANLLNNYSQSYVTASDYFLIKAVQISRSFQSDCFRLTADRFIQYRQIEISSDILF